jgi:hypothetical protein
MQILKLLDNEDMDPSELERIRDDVDYYIEVMFECLYFVMSICHDFHLLNLLWYEILLNQVQVMSLMLPLTQSNT